MVKVFFSYSQGDEEMRKELEIHLGTLKRQGIIEPWHDRRIGAGKEFQNEISRHFEAADIILLLVSPYFIATDYCYETEMSRAMERHEKGEARVIHLKSVEKIAKALRADIGELFAFQHKGKPLTMEDAIRSEIDELLKRQGQRELKLARKVLEDVFEWAKEKR